MVKTKIRRAVLVYQAGIANVLAVDRFTKGTEGRNARRLYQHAFGPCENFARGLKAAGVRVAAMSCNRAGDIAGMPWDTSRDDSPFRESWRCRGIPWFSGPKHDPIPDDFPVQPIGPDDPAECRATLRPIMDRRQNDPPGRLV